MFCKAEVHAGGRMVSFRQCVKQAGFGPNKAYCKVHAEKLSKKKALIPLWSLPSPRRRYMSPEDMIPQKIMVREIRAATFIDGVGKTCRLKTDWDFYYARKSDAWFAAKQRLEDAIDAAQHKIVECKRMLVKLKKEKA